MTTSPRSLTVTHSARDLTLWLEARLAEGAVRFVLLEHELPSKGFATSHVRTWLTNEPHFDAIKIAHRVQSIANAVMSLGNPRLHLEFVAFRKGSKRIKPLATAVIYGNDGATHTPSCSGCARKDEEIDRAKRNIDALQTSIEKFKTWILEHSASYTSLLRQQRETIHELDKDLEEADEREADLVRANEAARRAPPWVFPARHLLRRDN